MLAGIIVWLLIVSLSYTFYGNTEEGTRSHAASYATATMFGRLEWLLVFALLGGLIQWLI